MKFANLPYFFQMSEGDIPALVPIADATSVMDETVRYLSFFEQFFYQKSIK